MPPIDLNKAREAFESSTDFTVAIEEEFGLLDPTSLDLVQRFEQLRDVATVDSLLRDSLVGELISSEVEIRSGRAESFTAAVNQQLAVRQRLFEAAQNLGIALSATGTHPWAPWQDQHVIDTPHYHRVEDGLKYVAWRNNTFSMHVHVGIQGADRAVAVTDRLREKLPTLLALSANSVYLDGKMTGLHSVRSQIFTRSFPRCGVPDHYGSWDDYSRYVEFLVASGSVEENTQLWWSVRPHFSFGTVEVRICDAQSNGAESFAVAALVYSCIVQAALDYDQGLKTEPLSRTLIEENLWRAIRYGLDGSLIDLPKPVQRPTASVIEDLLEWSGEARSELGLGTYLDPLAKVLESGNGAQRQMRLHAQGTSMRDVLASCVREACSTYLPSQMTATTV